jgi:hypothetical protein
MAGRKRDPSEAFDSTRCKMVGAKAAARCASLRGTTVEENDPRHDHNRTGESTLKGA